MRPAQSTTCFLAFIRNLAGCVVFFAIAVALAWRIPQGIDLSDEFYYAIFIDDWLKGGFASSTFTTIHQTAMLAAFLPVKAYSLLMGSSDGFVLFLRVIYLSIATIISFAWLSLFVRICQPLSAWLTAACALAFIPFGLPAVSYNTLGMQGLAVALIFLGHFLTSNGKPVFLVLSSIGWAVSTSAYPTMIVPLAACLILLAVARPIDRTYFIYVCLVTFGQIVVWLAVALILSPDRLLKSITYLNAISDVDGFQRKLTYSFDLIKHNRVFANVLLGALVLGALRRRIGRAPTAIVTAMLVVSLFTSPVALFVRSHDVITILALTGLGLGCNLRSTNQKEKTISIIWCTSFVAGLATATTAYYSVLNFPVGASVAAIITLLDLCYGDDVDPSFATLVVQCVALAGCVTTSVFFFYGSTPGIPFAIEKMEVGPFAGLRGQIDQVQAIQWMQTNVEPLVRRDFSNCIYWSSPWSHPCDISASVDAYSVSSHRKC